MNRDELKAFEGLFLELKKNILNEMKLSGDSFEWSKGDELDQSLNDSTRALELKLLGRQTFMLKKIDHCLTKIKQGTYGKCEECDGEIEINRLKARPVATQCIMCKENEERREDNILYERKSHTLGKSILNNVIDLKQYREQDNVIAINSDY